MIRSRLIYLFLVAFCFACSDDGVSPAPMDFGYRYAPLSVGHFVEYQVDSIHYSDFTTPSTVDTFRYQIREEIDSSFIDGAGRSAYRLSRYIRADENDSYRILDVWSVVRTSRRLERQEENFRYIRLIFPLSQSLEWDGNALNILDEQEYEYTSVHENMVINGNPLDSVLTVLQLSEENLIERKLIEEQYATGIGLVSRRSQLLDLDFSSGEVRSGSDVHYQLMAWRER